jgi:hypothetical protein
MARHGTPWDDLSKAYTVPAVTLDTAFGSQGAAAVTPSRYARADSTGQVGEAVTVEDNPNRILLIDNSGHLAEPVSVGHVDNVRWSDGRLLADLSLSDGTFAGVPILNGSNWSTTMTVTPGSEAAERIRVRAEELTRILRGHLQNPKPARPKPPALDRSLLPKEVAARPGLRPLLRMCRKGDLSAFGVMADWLDEGGATALAHAFRWCQKNGRQPERRSPDAWSVQYLGAGRKSFAWQHREGGERPHYLSVEVYRGLRGEESHGTFLRAMLKLAAALDRLRRLWEV